MASIDAIAAANSDKIGPLFGNGIIDSATILAMLQAGRIRIGEFDNALLLEIDGEAYTIGDAFRLAGFRPG